MKTLENVIWVYSGWQSWLFHLLGKKLVKSQKAIEIS